MPARHPASDPSHLPAAGPTAAAGAPARRRWVAPVAVGFLAGWVALALPFYWLWPGPDVIEPWGLWFAAVIDANLIVVIPCVAIPLATQRRDGPVRHLAVGVLLSLAAVGCLRVWLYLYLVFG